MPFDFAQAEQMWNRSFQPTFALKVRLKTWRLCLQAKNHNKFAIWFFSAIFELVWEVVISNMHTKFGKDTWKTFQVITPTSKCLCRRRRILIAIAYLF